MARIAVIAGDGIGPEVMAEAVPILEWARGRGRDVEWKALPYSADHYLDTGETLPDWAFQDIRDAFDAVLFGAVGDPRVPDGAHAEGILLRLRRGLELGVNFRPCEPMLDHHVPLKGVKADEVHLEVFRENTEGPYCLVGRSELGWAVDEAHHSEIAVDTVLRAAFQRVSLRKCPLTLAHKANVLKHGHGLWLRVFRQLQLEFPGISSHAMHADALLCALVQNPRAFGVIVADNLFGDLISDLLAAFQGGMGLAASANVAPNRPFRCSGLFEPVHGSAPDLAGKGTANPCGMILSTGLMLRHLGWDTEASLVEGAVRQALEDGMATPDIGGKLTTAEMGRGIHSRLHR